jgi:HPt (histidine-containing phosphotransfer) domain-containing protein
MNERSHLDNRVHLDDEALQELREVMGAEFDVLIRTYLSDSADRIGALQSALAVQDLDAFNKSAHSFKGSCINIGAPRLGQLCKVAEDAGREGATGQASRAVAAIEQEFKIVAHLFESMLNR